MVCMYGIDGMCGGMGWDGCVSRSVGGMYVHRTSPCVRVCVRACGCQFLGLGYRVLYCIVSCIVPMLTGVSGGVLYVHQKDV